MFVACFSAVVLFGGVVCLFYVFVCLLGVFFVSALLVLLLCVFSWFVMLLAVFYLCFDCFSCCCCRFRFVLCVVVVLVVDLVFVFGDVVVLFWSCVVFDACVYRLLCRF